MLSLYLWMWDSLNSDRHASEGNYVYKEDLAEESFLGCMKLANQLTLGARHAFTQPSNRYLRLPLPLYIWISKHVPPPSHGKLCILDAYFSIARCSLNLASLGDAGNSLGMLHARVLQQISKGLSLCWWHIWVTKVHYQNDEQKGWCATKALLIFILLSPSFYSLSDLEATSVITEVVLRQIRGCHTENDEKLSCCLAWSDPAIISYHITLDRVICLVIFLMMGCLTKDVSLSMLKSDSLSSSPFLIPLIRCHLGARHNGCKAAHFTMSWYLDNFV